MTKSADDAVLVGDAISYTLTATNDGSTAKYNLAFRDVLPAGVEYTGPSKLGNEFYSQAIPDPQVITVDPDGTANTGDEYQVLIWSNVSDLPAGATQSLTFTVTPDAGAYPVGATVPNTGDAYANSNERTLPKFDGDGAPIATSITASGTSDPATTTITAIKIAKSEPSPEHELMRGVHDHTTVYTLTVTNNKHAATNDVTVVDYLPAQLEFLGCGGVDNSTSNEYGSKSLTDTPTIASDCPTSESVETIIADGSTPDLDAGKVYTKVTWSVDNLAASGTKTIKYAAGIPQRANEMFPDGAAPDPSGGTQAANLDNNTGLSTRELANGDEQALTNHAVVSGAYQGNFASGSNNPVTNSDSRTVTAEDIAIQKSVAPGTFKQGETATFTLKVEVSEYVNASNIVITDVIPDGLCPTVDNSTCSTDASAYSTKITSGSMQSITHDAGAGTYTLLFTARDSTETEHDGTVTIAYPVLMRSNYDQHSSAPTVSGDGYTNTVSLTGTTTTRNDVNAPASDYGDGGKNAELNNVTDASAAQLGSDAPVLKKTIGKQVSSGVYQCDSVSYTDNTTTPAASSDLIFQVGDRVCFTVWVHFSAANHTKNPVVTDFLPDYLKYVSATATTANTVTVQSADPVESGTGTAGGSLTWTLGTTGAGGDRFADPGQVFKYRIEATVVTPASSATPDLTGNLAKLTFENTGGTVGFLRDQVDFSIAAIPPVSIAKSHTGGDTVHGGDEVPYTITVTNDGTAANRNAIPMKDIVVKDILPDGITCSNITSISDSGSCSGTDPSVIEWTVGSLEANESTDLTYTMSIPDDPRVLTEYQNTTGVVSYQTTTNTGGDSDHYPDNTTTELKGCGGTTGNECDVPKAEATDKVTVANTSLTKTQTTGIDESNNDADTEAVIGETIAYTVTGTIPKHSTVYQGTISDTMPTGIALESASATGPSGSIGACGTAPCLTVTTGTGSVGKVVLDLGGTYTNNTDADQAFTITINARVTQDLSNTHEKDRKNTATFARKTASTGGTDLPSQEKSTTATIIEPSPTISKTSDKSTGLTAGETVTYTLTVGNASGRPTLYDSTVTDCVPAGLDFQSYGAMNPSSGVASGTAVDGDGSNGCSTGSKKLSWTIDSIAGGSTVTLEYTAQVSASAAGAENYTNTASIVGNDLDGDTTDGTANNGRIYDDTTTHDVTVAGAGLTKSVDTDPATTGDQDTATIGQTVTYTVTATLPANVNFYDAVIHDTLPDGISPLSVGTPAVTCTGFTTCPTATAQTTSGQTVGWLLGDVDSSTDKRTVTLTYTAVLGDDSTHVVKDETLKNSAIFGWNTINGNDPAAPGETPPATTTPGTADVTVTEPQMTIDKKVTNTDHSAWDESDNSKTKAEVGQTVRYTVTAANDGTSDAHDITVVDTLPSGLTNISNITGSGQLDSTSTPRTITWTIAGPMGTTAADAKSFTYEATLDTTADTQTNTAAVTTYQGLADGVNDSGRRTYTPTDVEDSADVEPVLPLVTVAKAATDGDLAYRGESKEFTITITSDSDATAYNVGAVDSLPANWTYDTTSAQVTVAGVDKGNIEPDTSGQTLTWTNLGDLTVTGQTIVITYTATPSTDAAVGHTNGHTNTVSVTAEDNNGNTEADDGHPYNGPDADKTVYIDSADVTIVKTVSETPAAGLTGTWALTVKNLGPDTAEGPFTVTDTTAPPTGFTLTGASGTGWDCSASDYGNHSVSCTRSTSTDTLAKNASFAPITLTYSVASNVAIDTTYQNTATVSGMKTFDPNDPDNGDDNNSWTASATVGATAEVGITKTLKDDHLVAGENAIYEIVVHNYGPADSQGPITVTDEIPEGTTFVSASGDGWTCPAPSGTPVTLTCTHGTLAEGADAATFTVTVKVDSDRTTEVSNTATVDPTTNQGTNTHPDTDDAKKTPELSADIAIAKRVGTSPRPGSNGTWLLTVTNNGPSDAAGIEVTDDLTKQADGSALPAGITYVSWSGDGWTCSDSDPAAFSCTRTDSGALKAGAGFPPITITYAADSTTNGTEYSNQAKVSTTTNEPDDKKANNTSEATVMVRTPPPPPTETTPTETTPPTETTTTSPTTTSADKTGTTEPTASTTTITPTSGVPTVTPSDATTPASPPPPTNVPPTTVPRNPDQCTEMSESGFEPGETVTLTVTGEGGQYALTATAGGDGTVAYCLDTSTPGTYTIEVLGKNRQVVRQVTVQDDDDLSYTGVDVATYLGIALLLLVGGAALVLTARRRSGRRAH